jgi:hypothetical protein
MECVIFSTSRKLRERYSKKLRMYNLKKKIHSEGLYENFCEYENNISFMYKITIDPVDIYVLAREFNCPIIVYPRQEFYWNSENKPALKFTKESILEIYDTSRE